MAKQTQKSGQARQDPGPGRSTSDQAFNELRREVAQRNEATHQEARKRRTALEREQILRRRDRDS
jgi:hypothetical protein